MSDLDLEAIKALDLSVYFNALLREWYDGYKPGDGTVLASDLRSRGVDLEALAAEVERLREVEAAARALVTHPSAKTYRMQPAQLRSLRRALGLETPSKGCVCGHSADAHTAPLLGGPWDRPCWNTTCPCRKWQPEGET